MARIVVGLPVAALWPLTVPRLKASRSLAFLAAALSGIYVLAPRLPETASWLLLAAALGVTAFLIFLSRATETTAHRGRVVDSRVLLALASVAALTLGTAALLDWRATREALETAIDSDSVALVASGGVACVFLGGAVVAWLLAPFAATLKQRHETEDLPSLRNAGRFIGWLERALLFALILGGSVEAAALALAAKSFARFPSLQQHHEGFAEYFLIGSLASIGVALAVAIGIRAMIGTAPL